MDKKWKNLFLLSVAFISSVTSFPVLAGNPTMLITTNQTKVTLIQTDDTIQYTVTNNTGNPDPKKGVTLSQLTIDPAFNAGKGVKEAANVQNNTCANAKLTPGSNCTFDILITGNNNLSETFVLSPRVCAFNKAACSQPDISNRVTVSIANTILALSDMHLDSTNNQPITYGNNTNLPLWKSVLNEITTLISQQAPKFIVFTGDLPVYGISSDFPAPSSHQKQDIMTVLTNLSNLDAIKTNNIPIFYAVGNNDSLLADYGEFFDGTHNLFYLDPAHNSPAKGGWPTLNANPDCRVSPNFACTYSTSPIPKEHASDMANVQLQGYYSAYPLGRAVPLRLISLNSVIFSRDYLYPDLASQTQLDEAQAEMDWLAAQLASAQKNNESVYIIMHVPVGMDAFTNYVHKDMWNATLTLNNGKLFRDAFLALMTQYKSIVLAVFSAHTHEDELRALYPDQTMMSMEVLDVGIPGITVNHFNNPGTQVYAFDKSYQLTEAKTYYTTPVPSGWNSFSFKNDYICPINSTMFSCVSLNILPNLPAWIATTPQPIPGNPYEMDYSVRNLSYTASTSTWVNILSAIQVIPII